MTSSHTEVTGKPEVESASNYSSATNGADSWLLRFAVEYSRYHGYISVVVCVLGIISLFLGIICSLLVIAVLTRRHMLTSSNYMLTALAICDLITMLSYVPYAIQFYCLYRLDLSTARSPCTVQAFPLTSNAFIITCYSAWIRSPLV